MYGTHPKSIYPVLWAIDSARRNEMPITIELVFSLKPLSGVRDEVGDGWEVQGMLQEWGKWFGG